MVKKSSSAPIHYLTDNKANNCISFVVLVLNKAEDEIAFRSTRR